MRDALRVVAHLASPLAGDPPHLDGLLVSVSSRLHGKGGVPDGYKVDRRFPCPDTHHLPVGITREAAGRFRIALCTAPVLPEPAADYHEYVAKRLGVEHAGLLDPDERRIVTTTNGWTKSYRLPLRVRAVSCVVWLCAGSRRDVRSFLKGIPAVGKKTRHGHGRVARWEVERIGPAPHRYWPWWIDSPAGPVLMRPLPLGWDGLPPGLVGARRGYGPVSDPYWHPDRDCERVEPC